MCVGFLVKYILIKQEIEINDVRLRALCSIIDICGLAIIFYLEECLIRKYVKLTGLDEIIGTNILLITCYLSVHACMSVRPTVCLISISYASCLSCFYIVILI